MSQYTDEYAETFEKTIKEIVINQKAKRMLRKAILFILEKPYFKAKSFEYCKEKIFRKNVCSGKFRIFYCVDENNKKIRFMFLRLKDKKTYKDF